MTESSLITKIRQKTYFYLKCFVVYTVVDNRAQNLTATLRQKDGKTYLYFSWRNNEIECWNGKGPRFVSLARFNHHILKVSDVCTVSAIYKEMKLRHDIPVEE